MKTRPSFGLLSGLPTWSVALLAGLGSFACKSSCDGEDQTLLITSGEVRTTHVDGSVDVLSIEEVLSGQASGAEPAAQADVLLRVYESSPWGQSLTRFEGGNSLEFVHGLGVMPEIVNTYLSFSLNGTNASNVAANAGDSSLVDCVDDEIVRIKNNTCENAFHVRVVAIATQTGSSVPEVSDPTAEVVVDGPDSEPPQPVTGVVRCRPE